MSKYTVKTELSNITQLKDGSFSYNEEITSMNDGIVTLTNNKRMSTQDAKDRQRQRQSGKSMGEFGENYSYRKKYQHDYHDSSGVKWIEPNITPQGESIYPRPIEERIIDQEKDHEGYEYEPDSNKDRTHKD